MDLHQWQSQLASELKTRKVPPPYARRLLRELQDHIFDLQEAEMNHRTEAENTINLTERLGDPKQLAERACAAQAYPTWSGRHPWLAFVAGTPAVFLLSVAGFTLLAIGVAFLAEGQTVETNPALMQACKWAGWTIAFVPAIVASLLLCRMVSKSGRRRLWALAACSLVALLAGCVMVSCTPPQSEPGTGNLSIGFGIGGIWRIAQAIAPLLIGVIFAVMGRPTDDKTEDDLGSRPLRSAA